MKETVIVTGLEAGNFMIDQGFDMIGLDGVPERLTDARMIFRGEGVRNVYGRALRTELPFLTADEQDRIVSMVALLSLVEEMKEEQEVRP